MVHTVGPITDTGAGDGSLKDKDPPASLGRTAPRIVNGTSALRCQRRIRNRRNSNQLTPSYGNPQTGDRQWAFTEAALVERVFSHRRTG
ncbi:MAG: hypothetical protein K0S86_2662 [Geminicoccaceae bacterium]|jgi:hypothetical protein|nr:hypothetical protein [Geminicoccaceae bacterium]